MAKRKEKKKMTSNDVQSTTSTIKERPTRINPTNYRGWFQVLRKGLQFLLHIWLPQVISFPWYLISKRFAQGSLRNAPNINSRMEDLFNINIYIFFILINKYNNQHTKKEKDRCTVSNKVHVYVQINNVNYPPPFLYKTGIFCVFDQLFVHVLLQSS